MKKSFIAYFLLVSSIFLLLSSVIPHHHHSDGTFCFSLTQTEESQHEEEGHHESTQCTCVGLNQATRVVIQSHVVHGAVWLFLVPLKILFSYTSPVFILSGFALLQRRAVYVNFLHDQWISESSGLRAPPYIVL